jgi:hypothetical protein
LNSAAYKGVAFAYLVELSRDPAVRTLLYRQLDSATRDEKIQLAGVFARSGDQESIPYLEKLSHDPDDLVSAEGLRALRALRARL